MAEQPTTVRVERQGAVCAVTVDWAIHHNALDATTLDELHQTFARLSDDSEARGIVLAGAETADIANLDSEPARRSRERGQALVELIGNFEKPIIAAINGAAFGGGCDLAFACALRVAAPEAAFAYPDLSRGVPASFGAAQRLPRLIGRARALELLLTGRKLSAAEALEWGLINRIVPAADLIAVSVELAERIATGAPLAIKYVLASIAQGGEMPLAEALQHESSLFSLCFATEDAREGARAFLEKRPPKFHGK